MTKEEILERIIIGNPDGPGAAIDPWKLAELLAGMQAAIEHLASCVADGLWADAENDVAEILNKINKK